MDRSRLNRILCAEDEVDLREIARMSLETVGGFTVKICTSGQEALDTAAKFKPDLILLDVMMPGMDGLSVLRNLRENAKTAKVPVVFLTARAQDHEAKEYLDAGAAGVVAKPFDPMKLPEKLRVIWDGL